MKKACIYIPFFILFLNNASLNQVFKLPALVCHFMEHHRLDNKVGILEFLSMHYWGDDLNDNDNDQDMQLPFKKAESNTCFQVVVPIEKITFEKKQFYIRETLQVVPTDNNLSNPALASLFRPPRA